MARWILTVAMCTFGLALAAHAVGSAHEDGAAARERLADWVPPGTDDYANSYARGLEIVLNYPGHEVLGERAGDRGAHPLRHPCYGTNWRTGVDAY
ncbi:hypothetical protein HN371_05195 [Candidatus Poribacteria bacterium]|jgi:hypothetical protein|nr:hypothetical protein [Candidatus Poribacteria bacterium]MBT5536440.1 hypothetical protein [Candidatus Poribacteria bacterium]MBT5709795.1 hypothetical protein [Candidatus Poribacteria bacterium]MBT7098448.1 hypothetical protein [Candidatus Poribacteria bacterium]MBT7805735.1 hypothetical protein [Candidatus Poribacteria bacterium]